MLTRIPISTDLPLSVDDAKRHTRIDFGDDDSALDAMVRAAAADVEDMAGLALLAQTVVMTTEDIPGRVIALPVGPMQAGADITVETLASDGTATTLASGWWIEAGRYPVLHLDAAPATRIRVTWEAALVEDAADLPADLRLAIADQVARMFDQRGGVHDKAPALSPHTARVIARYRRVAL